MKKILSTTIVLFAVGCGQPAKQELPKVKTIETKSSPKPETIDLKSVEAPVALSLDRWKQVNDPSQTETLYDIAFGNNTYVAIGNNNTILASRDSVLWERQTIEGINGAQQITFGAGTFVLTSRDQTYLSTDGKLWKPATEKGPSAAASLQFATGVFLQSYMKALYTSTDGQTWKENPFDDLRAGLVAYGAGQFIVADFFAALADEPEALHVLLSKDATSWEAASSNEVKGVVTGLIFAKEKFILLQGDGQLLTSADAKTWSKGPKIEGKGTFGALTQCADKLVLASTAPEGATVYSSQDASAWTTHGFAFPKGINQLACGDGALVAVGVDGAIFIAKI
jgi:hypothetical protein